VTLQLINHPVNVVQNFQFYAHCFEIINLTLREFPQQVTSQGQIMLCY